MIGNSLTGTGNQTSSPVSENKGSPSVEQFNRLENAKSLRLSILPLTADHSEKMIGSSGQSTRFNVNASPQTIFFDKMNFAEISHSEEHSRGTAGW